MYRYIKFASHFLKLSRFKIGFKKILIFVSDYVRQGSIVGHKTLKSRHYGQIDRTFKTFILTGQ